MTLKLGKTNYICIGDRWQNKVKFKDRDFVSFELGIGWRYFWLDAAILDYGIRISFI